VTLSHRSVVVLTAAQFLASTAIVLVASAVPPPLPKWVAGADITLVATLFVSAELLRRRGDGCLSVRLLQATTQVSATAVGLLIATVWMARDRVDLNILLPGLAWRTFLAVLILPWAASAFRRRNSRGTSRHYGPGTKP
jgi:hypothetical protein